MACSGRHRPRAMFYEQKKKGSATNRNFTTALYPITNILQRIHCHFRSNGHCLGVIRPEEIVTLVGFRGLPPILAQIEH